MMSARFLPAYTALRLLSLLILPALVFCGTAGPALAAADRLAGPGGEMVIALDSDVATLDPAVTGDRNSWTVASQLYECLTALDPQDNHPVPALATSWSVSADGLTWTFNVRSGVKFHDGSDLNADAVVFNLVRWWDKANLYHTTDFPYFSALFGYKGDPGSLIAGITDVNANTLTIRLTARDASQAYQQANSYVHDRLPLVPLAHTRSLMAQNRSVLGLTPSPMYADAYSKLSWVQSTISLPLVKR